MRRDFGARDPLGQRRGEERQNEADHRLRIRQPGEPKPESKPQSTANFTTGERDATTMRHHRSRMFAEKEGPDQRAPHPKVETSAANRTSWMRRGLRSVMSVQERRSDLPAAYAVHLTYSWPGGTAGQRGTGNRVHRTPRQPQAHEALHRGAGKGKRRSRLDGRRTMRIFEALLIGWCCSDVAASVWFQPTTG